jgi:hypothetical protein
MAVTLTMGLGGVAVMVKKVSKTPQGLFMISSRLFRIYILRVHLGLIEGCFRLI